MRDLYVRVYLDILANPKLLGAPPAAKWLYAAGFIVSARELSDGHVRPPVVCAEAEVPATHVKTLVQRKLWHQPGHDCEACPQPGPGRVVIHDYLDHQESKAKVEDNRAKKSAAGRKGARNRWHGTRHDASDSTRHGESMAYLDKEAHNRTDVRIVSQSQTAVPDGRGLTDVELEKIRVRLGASSVTFAEQVAREVLGRAEATVMRPLRYVLAAIDSEPDRYKPTAGPPRKDDSCPLPGHGSFPASNCSSCRSELISGGA